MLSIVLGYDLQAEDLRVEAARHFIVRTSDSGVMDAQKHDDGSENVRLSIRNGLYWPSCLPASLRALARLIGRGLNGLTTTRADHILDGGIRAASCARLARLS